MRPELLELSRRAVRESPVFIVGAPRSGTTLLFRLLQRHSSFRPRTENLMESKVVLHLHGGSPLREREPFSLWAFMGEDDEIYGHFLRSIHSIGPLYRLNARLSAHAPSLPGRWRASLNPLRLRSFIVHASSGRGARRLVEKTPLHVPHLAKLHHAFPRASFVFLHRHPVDVYSSYRRRFRREPSPGWDVTPEQFNAIYQSDVTSALAFGASHPRSLAILSYERLVSNPHAEMAALCRFLGERYEDPAGNLDSEAPPAGFVDPHVFGPITTQTKTWSDHVSGTEAAQVERGLDDLISRLGYARYCPEA